MSSSLQFKTQQENESEVAVVGKEEAIKHHKVPETRARTRSQQSFQQCGAQLQKKRKKNNIISACIVAKAK